MPLTLEQAIAIWKPEISSEKLKSGERSVEYRDLNCENHRWVTRDPEEAHAKFLEWVADLRAQIETLRHQGTKS